MAVNAGMACQYNTDDDSTYESDGMATNCRRREYVRMMIIQDSNASIHEGSLHDLILLSCTNTKKHIY